MYPPSFESSEQDSAMSRVLRLQQQLNLPTGNNMVYNHNEKSSSLEIFRN